MAKSKSSRANAKRKSKVDKAKGRARGYWRKRKSGGRIKKHRQN